MPKRRTETRLAVSELAPSVHGDALIPTLPEELRVVPGYDPQGDPDWHQRWFAWRKKFLLFREEIHAACAEDPTVRAQEDWLCSIDPARWAAMWTWIEEPRGEEVDGVEEEIIKPFVPFAFQVRTLQDFAVIVRLKTPFERIDSKARGLGASWNYVQAFTWLWLYREATRTLLVSATGEKVDNKGDVNSLFGKIDFILSFLPPWMLPEGFNADLHRGKMKLTNPENGAAINGATTTEDAGRSGRATAALVDEGAAIKVLKEMVASLRGTTRKLFAPSTESFANGYAWRELCEAAEKLGGNRYRTLEYQQNAYYALPGWLEAERERWANDPEGFAREVLRDAYAGSNEFVYPVARTRPLAHLEFNPHLPLVVGIDPGHQDATALVWMQRADVDGHAGLHVLGSYERSLVPAEWYAHLLTGIPPEHGDVCWRIWNGSDDPTDHGGRAATAYERELMKFFRTLPWSFDALQLFGDPAGKQKHTGHGFYDIVRAHSVILRKRAIERGEGRLDQPLPLGVVAEHAKGVSHIHLDRRMATRPLLEHAVFNDTLYGRHARECISNYKFAPMTPHSTAETKPVHDKYSHVTTAFEYACEGLAYGYGHKALSKSEKQALKEKRRAERMQRKERR